MAVRRIVPAVLGLIVAGSDGMAQQAGVRPIANLGPVVIDFGEVNIGHRAVVPVTLRNLTSAPMSLTGGGVTSSDGFGSLGGSCTTPVAAGASCTFNYYFQPRFRDGTERSASTALSLTAAGQGSTIPLSFRGRGIGTMIDFSPTRFDFGDVLLGQTVSVRVFLRNPLGDPVLLAGGGFSTANGFGAGSGTCSSTLAAGAGCSFVYSFTPGAQGPVSNATSVSIGLVGAPGVSQAYPVAVSGNGVLGAGLVTLAPVDFDFGLVRFGRAASVGPVITNVSPTSVSVTATGTLVPEDTDGMAFQGSFFNVGGGCDTGTLAPGATCFGLYQFAPREARAHAEATSHYFVGPGGADELEPMVLAGTGIGPLAQVYPVEADLGVVDLGTSASVTVTVRNDGQFELVNFIGGAATSPFASTTTCTGPLAPGAQCTYTYSYTAFEFALGPREVQTSITFGNSRGLQRTQLITIRAEGTALLFRHGFE